MNSKNNPFFTKEFYEFIWFFGMDGNDGLRIEQS